MTAIKARVATVHWIRFPAIMTPEQLPLSERPAGCMSWKIGPDGPVGPDGARLPSNVWCGVGLFRNAEAARIALHARECYLPLLGTAVESWHALLFPVTHRGECNHLDMASPGLLVEIGEPDPGGPLLAMTRAGFDLGPTLDLSRGVDFRRSVDRVREWLQPVEGRIATQVFTPHTRGDDGVTMSIWCDDAS